MANDKETRVVELIMNGSQAGSTIKALNSDVRTLQAHIRGLTPGTKEFVQASQRLQETKQRFKDLNDQVNGVSRGFKLFSKQFMEFAVGTVGGNFLTVAVEKILGMFPAAISGAAKLSDSLADIQKTTGMSAEEAKNLNSQLSKIDTRTGSSDLREIAIAAGQLGIAKQDILGFTAATDKLVVALGDEFSGGAEQVTKDIGALRNIFTDVKSDRIDADMLLIGNALNALGSVGAATGPVVADFANRIGSVGITLGLTSDQVLGLSATLQELNVSTERGGTAVSKILMAMSKNTTEFAKVAGMDVAAFKNLVNNDLYGAFLKVVEGSQRGGTAATDFSMMLDDMGVDGAGASEVFSKLGANTKLLGEKVKLAGTSLKGTDSIMQEFNTKNTNFAANVDKMGKKFNANFVAPVMGGIAKMFEFFMVMVDESAPLQLVLSEIFRPLREIVLGIGDLLVSLGLVTDQSTSARTMILLLAKAVQTAWMPFKLLTQLILFQIDGFRVLVNEGKKAANFFGADFKIDPKLNFGKLLNEVKDMGKTLVSPFRALPEEAKKQMEATTEYITISGRQQKNAVIASTEELSREQLAAQKRFADNTKKLFDEAAKAHAASLKDEENRELASLQEKLVQRKAEIKIMEASAASKNAALKALEEKHFREMADIKAKYQKQRDDKEYNDSVASLAAWHDRKKLMLTQAFTDGLITEAEFADQNIELEKRFLQTKLTLQQDYGKSTIELEQQIADEQAKMKADSLKKVQQNLMAGLELEVLKTQEGTQARLDAELALLEAKMQQELMNKELTENEKALIEEKFRIAKAEKEDQAMQDMLNRTIETFEQYSQVVQNVIGYVNQIQNNTENQQLQNDQRVNDQKKANLKKQLDDKIISQEQYDAEIAALDAQMDAKHKELVRKQALREKQARRLDILLNMAAGIMKAVAENPMLGGLPGSAIAATMGALQIAALDSAPMPEYDRGGLFKVKGAQSGRTYNASYGGRLSGYYSTPTLALVAENKPEYVIPNAMLQMPAVANMVGVLEGIRVNREFDSGGPTSASMPVQVSPVVSSSTDQSEKFTKALDANTAVLALVLQRLDQPLQAVISYDHLTDTTNEIENTISQASIQN